jgi:hypothetical protein
MNSDKNKIIRNWPFVGVMALVLAHAIINFIWLQRDNFPLWFDYGGYFRRSIEIYYASKNGFIDFIKAILGIGQYINAYFPHRILLPLISLPFYYIFGVTADVAVTSCTIFLAICLFSVYGIASRMFDRITGFLAVFVLSVSPGFFIYYRRYSPEFATTAMIALTAYFLLTSNNFQNKKYSILFGTALGLSMITKEMAFAFLPGIIMFAIYKAKSTINKKNVLLNFLISISIATVLVFAFYWLHKQEIINRIFETAYSEKTRAMFGMVKRNSLEGILYYFKDIANFGMPHFYAFFFMLGIFLYIKNKLHSKSFLLLWLAISYLMLSSMQTKCQVYGMPLLIPISIITAYGINSMFQHRIVKIPFFIMIIAWGSLVFWTYSFPIFNPSDVHIFNIRQAYDNSLYPINEDWKLGDIVEYIKENSTDTRNKIRIHVGANLYPFSAMTLAYVAAQGNIKSEFAGCQLKTEEVLSFDFVIVKSGDKQGWPYTPGQAKELLEALNKSQFVKLPKTFMLPDNSQVTIYKKLTQ